MKRYSLALVLLGLVFFFSQSCSADPVYNSTTNHWYDAVPANGDWYTAEANAAAGGGHLVTINNAAENDWIVQNFNSYTYSWVGFTDVLSEGNWVWVSSEPVTYTNWASGEPNNGGREDWAHMYLNCSSPELNGLWNDVDTPMGAVGAANFQYGIAEYNTNPVAPEPVSSALFILGGAVLGIKRFFGSVPIF